MLARWKAVSPFFCFSCWQCLHAKVVHYRHWGIGVCATFSETSPRFTLQRGLARQNQAKSCSWIVHDVCRAAADSTIIISGLDHDMYYSLKLISGWLQGIDVREKIRRIPCACCHSYQTKCVWVPAFYQTKMGVPLES